MADDQKYRSKVVQKDGNVQSTVGFYTKTTEIEKIIS